MPEENICTAADDVESVQSLGQHKVDIYCHVFTDSTDFSLQQSAWGVFKYQL
jgi:hypothetical protein